jgi:hypothetical protein
MLATAHRNTCKIGSCVVGLDEDVRSMATLGLDRGIKTLSEFRCHRLLAGRAAREKSRSSRGAGMLP